MLTNIFSNSKTKTFTIPAEQQVKGNVESSITVIICGSVQGDVITSSDVLIKAGGTVHGKISAVNAVVEGKVYGTISCREKVSVLSGAKIEGEIAAAEIHIEPGAVFVEKKEQLIKKENVAVKVEKPKDEVKQQSIKTEIHPEEKFTGVIEFAVAKATPVQRWF